MTPHLHLTSWLVGEQLCQVFSPSTLIFTCLLSLHQLFITIRQIQCPNLRNKLPWHSSNLTSQFLREKNTIIFWIETCEYVKTSFASGQPKLKYVCCSYQKMLVVVYRLGNDGMSRWMRCALTTELRPDVVCWWRYGSRSANGTLWQLKWLDQIEDIPFYYFSISPFLKGVDNVCCTQDIRITCAWNSKEMRHEDNRNVDKKRWRNFRT